ncbi:hypothetical protein GQX74_001727 [Glossina fuscipes]|nr:hypothetical protein GQX74_001727 [Glossina fuscipes]
MPNGNTKLEAIKSVVPSIKKLRSERRSSFVEDSSSFGNFKFNKFKFADSEKRADGRVASFSSMNCLMKV